MKTPVLDQLQSAFKDYLFVGANETELAASIIDTGNINSIQRLEVYRNAYYIRLQQALAHDFPVLLRVMGEEAFGPAMASYLQVYPSTEASLRYIGQRLAQWFYMNNEPGFADLVRLEWAIVSAFDAADADYLSPETLAEIPPDQWQLLRFTLHPSVTLLDVNTNVMAMWKASRAKKPIPDLQLNHPESLVVSRSRAGPVIHAISASHHTFIEALAEGKSFEQACELLTKLERPNDVSGIAAQYLVQALSNQWILELR